MGQQVSSDVDEIKHAVNEKDLNKMWGMIPSIDQDSDLKDVRKCVYKCYLLGKQLLLHGDTMETEVVKFFERGTSVAQSFYFDDDLNAVLTEMHRYLGNYYYEQRQADKALNHLEEGKDDNFFRLGCLYYNRGEYARAIECYEKCDTDANIYNNIGVSHEQLGNYDLAIEFYKKALKKDPNHLLAHLNLSTVEWKKKNSGTQETNINLKMSIGIVTHLEYARLSEVVYYNLKLIENWEILLTATEFSLDKEGYYSVAYVNHKSKSVVVAIKGTDNGAGVRADLWLTFDEMNIQFVLAEEFHKCVLNRMKEKKITDYRLSYTGHSLGGCICSFLSSRYGFCSVTFDAPGSFKLIQHVFGITEVPQDLSSRVINYFGAPNLINTIKPHFGTMVRIFPSEIIEKSSVPPSKSKPIPFYVKWVTPTQAFKQLEYVYSELDILIQNASQQHGIATIVNALTTYPCKKELVLRWPLGPFQCWSYSKTCHKLISTTEPFLKRVYETNLKQIVNYETIPMDESQLPLSHLTKRWVDLLKQFDLVKRHPEILSGYTSRLLCQFEFNGDFISTQNFLTGFEFQQLIERNEKVITELLEIYQKTQSLKPKM